MSADFRFVPIAFGGVLGAVQVEKHAGVAGAGGIGTQASNPGIGTEA